MSHNSARIYLTSHIWDFILCCLASTGLALNIFSSFYMDGTLADSIFATLLATLVCCLLLFLAGYNRKSLLVAVPVYIIAAIIVIAVLNRSNAISGIWESGNTTVLFYPIVAISALAVYLLSRFVWGTAVLLAAGGIITGAYRFLLYPVSTSGFILFMVATILLLLYRNYYKNIMAADAGKAMFARYFFQSFAVTAVVLGLACTIVFAVIEPLDLPTSELKLSTRFMSLEIVEKVGIFTQKQVTSQDLLTDDTSELTEIVRSPVNENLEPEDNNILQEEKQERKNLRNTEAISYDRKFWSTVIIVLLMLLLALVIAVIVKRYLRRLKYKKAFALPADEAVIQLYLNYMKLLHRAGYRKPGSLTWSEYVRQMEGRLSGLFEGETGLNTLTELYQQVLYGCRRVGEDDIELFKRFHGSFYPGLKREMGAFRYTLTWFIL